MTSEQSTLNSIAGLFLPRVTAGGRSPIIRIWRGITPERLADEYFTHIEVTGIPAYRRIEGNLGAYVLRRASNGVAEFVVISIWDSWDAIRRFTRSEDPDAAIYYEADRRCLLFQEPKVAHYELALLEGWVPIARWELNPFEGTS